VGLCIGHDTIFMKYSKAPIICLIAKDRAICHNSAAPLYAPHYFSNGIIL
jgi:uncharacterized metal-binding protein